MPTFNLANSLKRPRSTSNPPSPTSTSSPKRAASEDPFASSSDSGLAPRTTDRDKTLMTAHGTGTGIASSPLRTDGEGLGQGVDGEWVKRTEEVHLNEVEDGAKADGDNESGGYIELYNELLAAIPPPFTANHRFYLFPTSYLNDLKTLAFSDHDSESQDPAASLQLDLTSLTLDQEGQDVMVIQTTKSSENGALELAPRAEKEKYWEIKDGLLEDVDFKFLHEGAWEKLVKAQRYTGPSLPRYCLPSETIQLKPPIFTLFIIKPASSASEAPSSLKPETASNVHPIRFTCPTTTLLATFLNLVDYLVDHTSSPRRYWQIDVANPPSESSTLPALNSLFMPHTLLPSLAEKLLPKPSEGNHVTIEDSGLLSGDGIAVEIGKSNPFGGATWSVDVNADGKAVEKIARMPEVPKAPAPLFSKPAYYGDSGESSTNAEASSSKSAAGMQTRSQSRRPESKGKGLVGLVNLGNTCFMNSAVQCLSNTPELSDYFLSGVYKEELNPDNPLGMHGQIAKAFGTTVESLWSGTPNSPFSPRILKQMTSRFAPQFAGYGQHDTQEFIAFLLDGLHEDLNRIHKKPYIEKPDWKAGGGDRELAELGRECWEGYKKRNDSVIVDLFQGQLQSTLVCPECQKESITMDPFMYLTVPLPIAQHRKMRLYFVPRDPEQAPVKVELLVSQNASFQQVKEKLALITKSNPSHLVGFDLWRGEVYSWWMDSDHNSECKDNDEAVWYDLGVPATVSKRGVGTTATDGSVTVPVYTYKTVDTHRNGSREAPTTCELQPFFITLSKTEVSDVGAIREAIMRGYQRYTRPEKKDQLFVSSTSHHAHVPHTHAEKSPIDDEETVTEIHLDGDQTRVVETASRNSSSETDNSYRSVHHSPHLSPSLGLHRTHGSSTSLASMGSSTSKGARSSKLVPRGDLFKVHVADASAGRESSGLGGMFKSKDTSIQPLFKGKVGEAYKVFSPLENRLKIKKGMFNRITAGFNSMVSSSPNIAAPHASDADDDAPGPTGSQSQPSSAPGTPSSPQPVIRAGEGIFVEWNVKRFTEFFDTTAASRLEEVIDPAIQIEAEKKKNRKHVNLEDCLDEFSKEETLGQDDLWYCPVCKKHQAATKKLEIYKAPDILVICIKRFGNSRRLSDKLDNLVNFPIDGLDLEDRVGERRIARSLNFSEEDAEKYGVETSKESLVYDLYGVDNHFGGMGGGHYTAFCRNKVDGEWYNYDDSRVSRANVEAVQSRAAYLLFYRRRTTRPIGGISRIKAEQASRAASPALSPPSYTHAPPQPQAPHRTVSVPSSPSMQPESDRSSESEISRSPFPPLDLTSASSSASTLSTPNMPSPSLSEHESEGPDPFDPGWEELRKRTPSADLTSGMHFGDITSTASADYNSSGGHRHEYRSYAAPAPLMSLDLTSAASTARAGGGDKEEEVLPAYEGSAGSDGSVREEKESGLGGEYQVVQREEGHGEAIGQDK